MKNPTYHKVLVMHLSMSLCYPLSKSALQNKLQSKANHTISDGKVTVFATGGKEKIAPDLRGNSKNPSVFTNS